MRSIAEIHNACTVYIKVWQRGENGRGGEEEITENVKMTASFSK
jgi:hypothetical protein